MKKFKFTVEETYINKVVIEAKDEDEAREILCRGEEPYEELDYSLDVIKIEEVE